MNETMHESKAVTEQYPVDIAEQSIGGSEVTYGDIYRVVVAASIKRSQMEEHGMQPIDATLVTELSEFTPLDQKVKDGGENAIMKARGEAISNLNYVLSDDEQLDMLLSAVEPDTPLEKFLDYISSQTDTQAKTDTFYDIITNKQASSYAISRLGTVEVQKTDVLEPFEAAAERAKPAEDVQADPEEFFMDAVRQLVAQARAKQAADATSPDEQSVQLDHAPVLPQAKKTKPEKPKLDREVVLAEIEEQMEDFAGVLVNSALKHGKSILIDERHIFNIEGLDAKTLALTLSANLLSCNEREANKQYTKRDLVTMFAFKITQASRYRKFDITGRKGRGKEQMEAVIDRTLERINSLEVDKTQQKKEASATA